MKKIKYQGAATKIITCKIAALHKKIFSKNIDRILKNTSSKNAKVEFDVISYSGANSFEDQVLSVYSFIYYAGVPMNWTIYSDKSYSPYHKNIFKKYFPFISVVDWDVFNNIAKNNFLSEYLKTCHLAKKVNIILGHEYKRQTIYADSDVIFYKCMDEYLSAGLQKGLWYAPDASHGIKDPLIRKPESGSFNSGFLIINDQFQKQDVLDYFQNLKGSYNYFSEQSSLEFAFKKQGAHILDPNEFIVDTSDQFDFSFAYKPADIALRHYVTPVRHKIWQKGWQWHFVQ